MSFSDASHGWAVGLNHTILATTNGGASWSAQNSGAGHDFWGVHFVDATPRLGGGRQQCGLGHLCPYQ